MKISAFKAPSDLDIQALVDSQLTPEDEKWVWYWLYQDPGLYARYQELVAQKNLLLMWWQHEKE